MPACVCFHHYHHIWDLWIKQILCIWLAHTWYETRNKSIKPQKPSENYQMITQKCLQKVLPESCLPPQRLQGSGLDMHNRTGLCISRLATTICCWAPLLQGNTLLASCSAGSGKSFKVMSQLGDTITFAMINKSFLTERRKKDFPREVCASPLTKKQPESLKSG